MLWHPPSFLIAVILALLGCMGCAEELPEPKPQGPNLSALRASYTTPSLPLTSENAPKIIEALSNTLDITAVLCGWEDTEQVVTQGGGNSCEGLSSILGVFQKLAGPSGSEEGTTQTQEGSLRVSQQSLTVGTTEIDGEGFLQVKRICSGWGGEELDEAENGVMELTIGFTDKGLDAVIWGDFKNCKFMTGGKELLIDAGINISLDTQIPLEDFAKSWMILEFDVRTLSLGAKVLSDSFDMSINFSGGVGFSINTGQGNIVLVSDTDGFHIRAENGTWDCNLQEPGQCLSNGDLISILFP